MRRPQTDVKTQNRRLITAALAILCAWRLPVALGLGASSAVLASHAISVAIAAAVYLLIVRAFACEDARLNRYTYGLGLLFSCLTLVGERLKADGAFGSVTFLSALDWLMTLALLALVYGAALTMLYRRANIYAARKPGTRRETLYSRLLGNGFIVFALLLLCWLPAWLACYPGTFVADSVTQFYTYMDEAHTTHHPLLHTLFLGFCMMTGIDMDPEGFATAGLAIYSVAQMVLMAAIVGYACWWMRRRRAPTWLRTVITALFALFPTYSLWSFSAQKDVLFAGFTLLFVLQLVDLWRDGYRLLRSPWRIAAFVLTATAMMLFRNNGVYALCLLLPLAVACAKGARLRVAGLLVGCVATYLLANMGLIWLTNAEKGSTIEMLSIPLQQIARTERDDPNALTDDERELLHTLYDGALPSEYYYPPLADPVKWACDYELLEENVAPLLSMWARLGTTHLKSYAEAFLVQNLPYYLPGADALYHFDLGVIQIDMFPIEEHSYLPGLRKVYNDYDKTLTLFGLPGVRLMSDTAFFVWLALGGFALALYRRERMWLCAFGFLLAVWATCLLGPIALMRYMLGIFYAVPVLLAAMLAPRDEAKAQPKAIPQR